MWTVENPPEFLKHLSGKALADEIKILNHSIANCDGDPCDVKLQASVGTPSGMRWEVVVIEPGVSKSTPPVYWTDEVLAKDAQVFQGADVHSYEIGRDFFDHLKLPAGIDEASIKRFLVKNKAGRIVQAWYEKGVGIKGIVEFLPSQKEMIEDLRADQSCVGLSIDSRIQGFKVKTEAGEVLWPHSIKSCSSVDIVTRPAAGGRFLRAVAAMQTEEKQGMNKLLQLIKKKRPDLLVGRDVEKMTDEEIEAVAQMAMETPAEKNPETIDTKALVKEAVEEAVRQSAERQTKIAACQKVLQSKLATSQLPAAAQIRVMSLFEGREIDAAKLDETIAAEKDYIAQMSAPPEDFGVGDQGRAQVGDGTLQKIQMAVDKLFGLTPDNIRSLAQATRLNNQSVFPDLNVKMAESMPDAPRLSGLAELYVLLSGDAEVSGQFNRAALPADLRACQSVNSSTFTILLGNTMARRMVNDYRAPNYGENLLISIRKPVNDFRLQEAVNVGYFGDIDDVDPEAADYQEISAITDEENTYRVGQKGNLLTITRKTIINDDISVITRILNRVPRALRRTHAKYVWAFWTGNANCTDGTAWFTGGHGNLGAAALTFATALIAYKAIASFTEKDSGEKIGFLDDPMAVKPVLVYPIALMETGETIVNDDYYYASNDLTDKTRNPLKGKISGQMVSLLSDDTDWGLIMPPNEVDILEMGYLKGREEPEVFVADQPSSEQMFVADKVRYKYRHEYGGAVIDYRGGYKAVVA